MNALELDRQRELRIRRKRHWREVSEEHGLSYETYRYRIQKLGWGPAKAAMHPTIISEAKEARGMQWVN